MPTPPSTLADVDAILRDVEECKALDARITTSEALLTELGPHFDRWRVAMTALSASGRDADADRIATAIVAMRGALMPLFPRETPDAFVREEIPIAGGRIDAAQFFEPVRYYPHDESMTKLYRFSVYQGPNVVSRYYLEHSNIVADYYVLGHAGPDGHRQVEPYGGTPPSYATLRARVLQDIASPSEGVASSTP